MLFRFSLKALTPVLLLTTPFLSAQSADLTASAPVRAYASLHIFQGGTDGSRPVAPLLRDPSGNLFGTTSIGGNAGWGTVFKVSASGTETVFYTFQGGNDGAQPFAGLIRDSAGNLYGTTDLGGGCPNAIDGCGTIFRLSPTGHETVLHRFQGSPDGMFPFGSLVRDSAGNLYGTTTGGGAYGLGTVFKLSAAGQFTLMYNFTGGNDGTSPAGTLVRDASGNLYGTTTAGGAWGLGGVFMLDTAGLITVLHSFNPDGTDGYGCWSGLVRNAAGVFFGTTIVGGRFSQGTVFAVTAGGQEKVVYNFTGGTDGGLPLGVLSVNAAGDLFGTTQASSDGSGTVFRIDPAGHETVLYTFSPTGTSDGATPQGGVIRDSSGNLYGTTQFGGTFNAGVVFKITP